MYERKKGIRTWTINKKSESNPINVMRHKKKRACFRWIVEVAFRFLIEKAIKNISKIKVP
ncbi:MAG: hypothetical protein Q8R79_00385 [Legionellaceae bacterium]|nr:hypothetical protein [Legionellaceae bacterium]